MWALTQWPFSTITNKICVAKERVFVARVELDHKLFWLVHCDCQVSSDVLATLSVQIGSSIAVNVLSPGDQWFEHLEKAYFDYNTIITTIVHWHLKLHVDVMSREIEYSYKFLNPVNLWYVKKFSDIASTYTSMTMMVAVINNSAQFYSLSSEAFSSYTKDPCNGMACTCNSATHTTFHGSLC